MTCDDAIQLLPWLLNGTLEEGQSREVRQHLETCERCREALAETREAWTVFGQHLPSKTLVALAYGEVPEEVDPALAERHLASCPECAAELELARTSRQLEDEKIALFPAPKPKPADDRGARTWRSIALAASFAGLLVMGGGWFQSSREVRRLSTELAEKPATAPAGRPEPATPPVSGGNSGAQAKIAELETQVQELTQQAETALTRVAELEKTPRGLPELNTWNQSLELESNVVRGENEESVIPAGIRATPMLPAQEGVASLTRDIEILDASGKVVWSDKGLRQDPDSEDYTFTLPAHFLKPGRYTIQLYSTEDGKRMSRETYKIRVQ